MREPQRVLVVGDEIARWVHPHQSGQSRRIDLGMEVPEPVHRVHRTVSPDGMPIAGEVVGEGAALVRVHGRGLRPSRSGVLGPASRPLGLLGVRSRSRVP
jgi:hypothetical protein